MFKSIFFFTTLTALTLNTPLFGQTLPTAGDIYNFSEESKVYTKMFDIPLNTMEGNFHLSDLYAQKPIIMALVFTRCTGICSPFLLQLHDHLRSLDSKKKFSVLVVSFDPKDSLSEMQSLAARFQLQNNKQWIFATTPQIDSLKTAIDFYPIWDSTTAQFDHEALLVGINENGYIGKKLLGMRDERALLSLIKEINNEFVFSYPLPAKNTIFSCFTYDPATGKKKPSLGLLILLLPAIITLSLLLWLGSRKPKLN